MNQLVVLLALFLLLLKELMHNVVAADVVHGRHTSNENKLNNRQNEGLRNDKRDIFHHKPLRVEGSALVTESFDNNIFSYQEKDTVRVMEENVFKYGVCLHCEDFNFSTIDDYDYSYCSFSLGMAPDLWIDASVNETCDDVNNPVDALECKLSIFAYGGCIVQCPDQPLSNYCDCSESCLSDRCSCDEAQACCDANRTNYTKGVSPCSSDQDVLQIRLSSFEYFVISNISTTVRLWDLLDSNFSPQTVHIGYNSSDLWYTETFCLDPTECYRLIFHDEDYDSYFHPIQGSIEASYNNVIIHSYDVIDDYDYLSWDNTQNSLEENILSRYFGPETCPCKQNDITINLEMSNVKEKNWVLLDLDGQNQKMNGDDSFWGCDSFIPLSLLTKSNLTSYCVEPTGCYQFIFTDNKWVGEYSATYKNNTFLDHNINLHVLNASFFGQDDCTRSSPSITSSYLFEPAPEHFNPFQLDRNNRRYFPTTHLVSNQHLIQNCTVRVGCIDLPSTTKYEAPSWAGRIYMKIPSCDNIDKICSLNFPVSMKASNSKSIITPINTFSSSESLSEARDLPGSMDAGIAAIADVNNDGFDDIVTYFSSGDSMVLLNSGDSTFKNILKLPCKDKRHQPISSFADMNGGISCADLNGDGWVDILIGSCLMYNDASGGFSLVKIFSEYELYTIPGNDSPPSPWVQGYRRTAIADVNNDGWLDIIDTQGVQINAGNGYNFYNQNIIPDSHYVIAADFDKDGWVDIIIGYVDQPNFLLLNDGNGKFDLRTELPGGIKITRFMGIADVNGDEWLDIIVVNGKQSNQLIVNQGFGTFNAAEELAGGILETTSVTAADINNDGWVDIIFGNKNSDCQILLNHGYGSFNTVEQFVFGERKTLSISAGDLNNDGIVDIVLGTDSGMNHQIFFNYVRATVNSEFEVLPGGELSTYSIAVADVNGDGWNDIIVGNGIDEPNHLIFNKGYGIFDIARDIPGSTWWARTIAVSDVNNDGWIDVVIGNSNKANQLIMNDGSGDLQDETLLPGGEMDTYSITSADVNGDGLVDIIVANCDGSNQILLNDGSGTFSNAKELPGSNGCSRSIVAADVNTDNRIDIIVANYGAHNLLLLNEGGVFIDFIKLPHHCENFRGLYTGILYYAYDTMSIGVADFNQDGMIDIYVQREIGPNYYLWYNFTTSFFTVETVDAWKSEICSGEVVNSQVSTVAIADMNGNGQIDIITARTSNEIDGYSMRNTITLASHGILDLPGTGFNTQSVSIADVNGDGWVDIVQGNAGQPNTIVLYGPCLNDGAQIHSKSWCFQCPSFMGILASTDGVQNPICRECLPDYLQSTSVSTCELDIPCPSGHQRLLGSDLCKRCPEGTYQNNTFSRSEFDVSTLDYSRCVLCSPGEYGTLDMYAVNRCAKCRPGTYQSKYGQSDCVRCLPGSYQANFGEVGCNQCSKGGYCNNAINSNGGFTQCSAGTYNDALGRNSSSACTECAVGTFSTAVGAVSISTCEPCFPGTYNSQLGQTACLPCGLGTSQSEYGQTSCNTCDGGFYADKTGFKECVQCPYRLSSDNGSETCPYCDKAFFMGNVPANSLDIFKNPSKYCSACPKNVTCDVNSTLPRLGLKKKFWRQSPRTSRIYTCNNQACVGGSNSDSYCKEGYSGPLCETCIDKDYYYSFEDGICSKCPPLHNSLIRVLIFIFLVGVAIFIGKKVLTRVPSIHTLASSWNIQAILKIQTSFFQVILSLQDVYGVNLPSRLTNMIGFLSLDVNQVIKFPASCFNMSNQLIIQAMLPHLIIIFGIILIWVHSKYSKGSKNSLNKLKSNTDNIELAQWKRTAINWTIMVLYFTLPVVSRRIFDARKCRAFQSSDDPIRFVSYFLVDKSIQCDKSEDEEYGIILDTFWFVFILWPVLIPLIFLVMLIKVSKSIRSNSISSLANACRFLWGDYNSSMLYWDILDTLRKIFLTGIIMFIDPEEGSNKLLRLLIAIITSLAFLTILLAFHPYKRHDTLMFSLISNFLLICCFTTAIILKLCDADTDGNNGSCEKYIGLSLDNEKATTLVTVLVMAMLLVTILLLFVLTLIQTKVPILRMVSSGQAPNLELPAEHRFHVFLSHVWGTGQAKTHAIARKMQLYCPGFKIWLDVDCLDDITKLEESVSESNVFILFYSDGYFRSRNCKRELYAAIQQEKPVLLVYTGNDTTLQKLKEECISHCTDQNSPSQDCILSKLFTHQNCLSGSSSCPIQWLNEGAFSATSLKYIYKFVLQNLPYYQNHPMEINKGLTVPGEMSKVGLKEPVFLLFDALNPASCNLVEEIQEFIQQTENESKFLLKSSSGLKSLLKSSRSKSNTDILTLMDDPFSYLQQKSNESTIDNEDNFSDETKSMSTTSTNQAVSFLLYLNKDTFTGKDHDPNLITIVELCMKNPDVSIILVHEQDVMMGGCEFSKFFETTPQHLIYPPNQLFRDIAVPLYKRDEYRAVSLNVIISKLG